MFFGKFRGLAQVVGFVTIGLLAFYGFLALLNGTHLVWAIDGGPENPAQVSQAEAVFVPQLINYQGRLRSHDGTPLSGYYTLTLSIYDSSVGGTRLWSEQQVSVTVRDGYFNVLLGDDPANPFPQGLFNVSERYIGVQVGSYAELVPRQRFTSVPYAMHAEYAAYLSAPDGDPVNAVVVSDDGDVGIGTTAPNSKLVVGDGVVTSSVRIPRGGLCVDADGACNPPVGGLRVGSGGILGADSSGKNVILVPSSGNVGIGTQGPRAGLEVANGAILGQGPKETATSAPDDSGNAEYLTYMDGVSDWGGIGGYQSGGMWLRAQTFSFWTPSDVSAPSHVVQIDENGKVGIGTTSPTTELDVAGDAHVSGDISWDGHLSSLTLTDEVSVVSSGEGTKTRDLVRMGNSLCFLTTVSVHDVDDSEETGSCYIGHSSSVWQVGAYSTSGKDNVVECRARCLKW